MMSIVLPAYNEATVIARALTAILAQAAPGEFEVIVVCNGCRDDTAEVARRFGASVTVIETPVANKTHALNLGDQAARGFPRFYVDADVVVTPDVLRALARRLEKGDVLVCSPTGRMDATGSSWPVRQYFKVRSLLPSAREGVGGSGVYALSEAGRRRFDHFPEIVADDAFVRFQFAPRERETLSSAKSTVFAPRALKPLLSVRSRIYYGMMELSAVCPDRYHHEPTTNVVALLTLLKRPKLWAGVLIYSYVCVAARARAKRRSRVGGKVWQRDDTTRALRA